MVAVEFDRPKMRQYLLKFLAIFLGVMVSALTVMVLLQAHAATTGWPKLLVTLLTGFVIVQAMDYVEYIGLLSRGLGKKIPAVVINQIGIQDNASKFSLGQLAWSEIEKMYPCDCKSRLLANRWRKMPVIFKQHGITIILKDSADLRHLQANKPRWVQKLSQEWYRPRNGRWLFIPEMLLDTPAIEVMERLNQFYVAEVRGG